MNFRESGRHMNGVEEEVERRDWNAVGGQSGRQNRIILQHLQRRAAGYEHQFSTADKRPVGPRKPGGRAASGRN